jgi:hypothetical protein
MTCACCMMAFQFAVMMIECWRLYRCAQWLFVTPRCRTAAEKQHCLWDVPWVLTAGHSFVWDSRVCV